MPGGGVPALCLYHQVRGLEKDSEGRVHTIRCTYDPIPKPAEPQRSEDKGTTTGFPLLALKRGLTYDRLFNVEDPADESDGQDWMTHLNPESLEVVPNCLVEPFVKDAQVGQVYQFERLGYFCVDEEEAQDGSNVFNRTVTLRDSWAKTQKK